MIKLMTLCRQHQRQGKVKLKFAVLSPMYNLCVCV